MTLNHEAAGQQKPVIFDNGTAVSGAIEQADVTVVSAMDLAYAWGQTRPPKTPLDSFLSAFLERYVSFGTGEIQPTAHAYRTEGLIVQRNDEDCFNYDMLMRKLETSYTQKARDMQAGFVFPFTLDNVKDRLHGLIQQAGDNPLVNDYLSVPVGAQAVSGTVKAKQILQQMKSSGRALLRRHWKKGVAAVGVASVAGLWVSGMPYNKTQTDALLKIEHTTGYIDHSAPIVGKIFERARDMNMEQGGLFTNDLSSENDSGLIVSKLLQGDFAKNPDDPSKIIITYDDKSPPGSDNNLFNGTIDDLLDALDAHAKSYADAAQKSQDLGYWEEYGNNRAQEQRMTDAKKEVTDWLQHRMQPKLDYSKMKSRSPGFDQSIFSAAP